MKDFIRKIWNAIVKWIYSIPADKKMHFWAGFFIATFFAVALGWKFCIWPAILAGILKEAFDAWTTKEMDVWDLIATLIGGALPQIFVLLNIWWF